ncbi:hypothetical protein ACHWQZ_G016347 [Mnemiopsis leidyi]
MNFSLLLSLTLLSLHLVNSNEEFTEVDFLSTFGYIDFGGGGDGAQDSALVTLPEDVKSNAISEFQSYYGLAVTGVMDDATRAAMATPRCGVPDKDSPDEIAGIGNYVEEDDDEDDIEDNIGAALKKKNKKNKKNKKKKGGRRRSKRYVTSATKWRSTKLSYRFLNYTADIPEVMTRSAFREAFSMWEEVSALQFYEETNSRVAADIDIAYMTGLHEDRSTFNSLVLAHAFFPRVGWLHMNDMQRWNYNSVQGTDTTFVALHELGHILGLRHSRRNTVMHASYPGYSPDLRLSEDDIKGIQHLYGPNPCYPNNPCQNGGSCRKHPQGGLGYVCSCTSGYQGTKCQNKITEVMTRKCRAITISNGFVSPAGRLNPNDVARIYCDNGFELEGASVFTCTYRGHYTPSTANTVCRRKLLCPEVSLENGEVYPRREVEPETVVSFSCNDDFQLSGSRTVKCNRDGTFDREPPTCEKIVEEEEEDDDSTGCPVRFDAVASRTTRDSMIFAFRGTRYWIYKRGETGAPKSHWKSGASMSHGFANIPAYLDTAFSYTDPDTRTRYMCFVKYPQVYFWDIMKREIDRVADFQNTFNIPGGLQITAAHRWDEDTVYFFVPFGYYVYKIKEQTFDPPNFQPMTNFLGMSPRVTATAASKSFYNDVFNIFVGEQVYQIRMSDKQVLRNNPHEIKKIWRYGLAGCT